MRIVIGSGRNRHSFEIPRDPRERQAMIDEVLQLKFGNRK